MQCSMVGSVEHDLIYAYVWHRVCFWADDHQLMQDRGLIPRVFQELFAQIRVKQAQQVCLLSNSSQLYVNRDCHPQSFSCVDFIKAVIYFSI